MQTKNRLVTVALAAALIAGLSGSALADVGIIVPEFLPDPLIRDQATDRPVDVVTDRPDDEVTDRLADKPSDVCPSRQVDRHTRCVSDRPTDRPVDRCLLTTDYPRRCINDHRPHDFNYRKLIWRLIHAHEWEKLVRLLHAPGLL